MQRQGEGGTCGDLLQGGGPVCGLDGREHEVEGDDEDQRQAPDREHDQRHEVRCDQHVRQHRQACNSTDLICQSAYKTAALPS